MNGPRWLRRRLKAPNGTCPRCTRPVALDAHGRVVLSLDDKCTCQTRCTSLYCLRTSVRAADMGRAGRVQFPDDQLRDATRDLRHRD